MSSPNNTANTALKYTPIEDIPKIRERLRSSFKSGKSLPLEYRKTQLMQLAYLLKENVSRFEEAFKTDLGRPQLETITLEINPTITDCITAFKNVEKWAKPEGVPYNFQFSLLRPIIYKQPKGVVLIIGPFNYPIFCSLAVLVGAIAAGCGAVVKLSELTPNISGLVAELWPKYMDEDVYQIVNGAIPETTAILDLQWDHILFTGSGTVGKIVAAAAAKHLTPTTLELGGQCPVFVDTNIDLKAATHRILWGKTMNVGQTCVAPNHIFVPADQQEKLVEALKSTYEEFYPEGAVKSASVARIVSDGHYNRIKDLLDKTEGDLVCGGETDPSQRLVAPTIVKNVKMTDPLMRAEIFGPVLPIVPVKDYQEAIDLTNARDHPLALYVFTDDAALKKRIINNTTSGAVDVNDVAVHIAVPGLPFGGVGPSGYGQHTGKYSFDTFTHSRSSVDSPRWIDSMLSWRYPPYTDAKINQSQRMAPRIPVPRPGPGLAPVTQARSGWLSWVSRRPTSLYVLFLSFAIALTLRRSTYLDPYLPASIRALVRKKLLWT